MSSELEVVIPRLGVNEDAVTVATWNVKDGDAVHHGQKLAELETTKASVALESEADGYVYLYVEGGREVQVQDVVAVILDAPDPARAAALRGKLRREAPTSQPEEAGPQLTARARRLLEAGSVDVSALPRDRIIRESDVAELIGRHTGGSEPGVDKTRRVVVYGASQGGAATAEAVLAMGGYEVVAFLDDTPGRAGGTFAGLPIWEGSALGELSSRGIGGVVTHIMVREFRLSLRDRAAAAGLAMPNVIHPRAYVAPSARMGVGNVIKAGAVVDTAVRMGDCCIIDNGVVVAHNNVIGDGCSLAPGVKMAGDSRIGERTLIGTGATLSERLTIGANVIISPGAVVVRDVPDNVIASGSPARVVGERRQNPAV